MTRLIQVCIIILLAAGCVLQPVRAVAPSGIAQTPPAVKTTPAPTPDMPEYVLPYPGILPTHPLYFLKNLRDMIIESLIQEPAAKTEFYVLQADKKFHMAVMLRGMQKTSEAQRAEREATESHAHAIRIVTEQAAAQTPIRTDITERLLRSISRHRDLRTEYGMPTDIVSAQRDEVVGLLGR